MLLSIVSFRFVLSLASLALPASLYSVAVLFLSPVVKRATC